MNRNLLLAPLVKSAVLLFVVTLLIYLTATSPEGSFWSSVGTLFVAIFRVVQLSIGLLISLLFCLIVLTGIFLGCVAMISRESAGKMLDQLRREISDRLLLVRALLIREDRTGEAAAQGDSGRWLEEELHAALEGSLDIIRQDQTAADRNIEWLLERMDRIEERETPESPAELFTAQEGRMKALEAGFDSLSEKVADLQKGLEVLSRQAREDVSGRKVEEFGVQLAAVKKDMHSLEKELSSLVSRANAAEETAKESDSGDDSVGKRLFAHIPNAAMQGKIEQLVTETLDSDMSYAQVIDHLVKQTGGKTAETIAAHPSLTREYIRHRRKNG